ncbi:MAG TPA: CSLREA domain-containing protein, partial [Actinomycetota bacterium]|nr:CSLREA domain-containing protein [Actinomycetota bacterium]
MRLRQTRDAAVRTAAIVVMALAAVGATSVPARAGAIAVTTTSDEAGSGPACSLREAILSANGDSAVGGCAAGSSTATDVISLPPGDYALAAGGTNEDAAADGDLDVTGNVDIEGAGADVTVVDGNGSVGGERVFQVFAPAVVTIRGVTIRDGHGGSGGGLSNLGGTVHLLHSAVTGNVGGNGGGLLNQSGTLDVVDSVV